MPSEFNHMQAVMAQCARRPLLVLREKALAERGAFRSGYLPHVVRVPSSLNIDWFDSPDFCSEFNRWFDEVNCFRHIFLGYSSKAIDVATAVYKFLTEHLKLRVFDWRDFRIGDTIWESIERGERLTTCGLFLFMADDKLVASEKHEFAPRDNVVYEAGYFAGAKGLRKSLVIREEGAKVPTDLDGILYIALPDRTHLSPAETPLREHLERMLGAENMNDL